MDGLDSKRIDQINRQTVDRSDMFYWQTDRPMTMKECSIIFGKRQDVDNDDLKRYAQKALDENDGYKGALIVKVQGGDKYTIGSVNVNRNFVLNDGREIVGRFHPRGIRNGYFSVESLVTDLAISNGVPAAKPVAVYYAKNSDEMDFVLFEKVHGSNMKIWLNTHPDDEEKLVIQVGITLARINQIQVDGFGFFDNDLARDKGVLRGIHSSYKEHIMAALPKNLDAIIAAGIIKQSQGDKIASLLQGTNLTDCNEPRLIHNDLADWNTLVGGGKVTAAIDWDEAHTGDPIADIACWSLFFPKDRLGTMLSGYKQVSELPKDFEDKLHIYRLRYLVCKLALRHMKYQYLKTQMQKDLIEVGKESLVEESAYFGLS